MQRSAGLDQEVEVMVATRALSDSAVIIASMLHRVLDWTLNSDSLTLSAVLIVISDFNLS